MDIAKGEKIAKIMYVSNVSVPSNSASSVHVMKMCEAFKKNGVDITLVIPNHYNRQKHKEPDIFSFYGIKEPFPVKRMKFIRKNVKGIREIIYSVFATIYAVGKGPDVIMTRKIMVARIAAIQSKHMRKLIVISEALKIYIMEKYHIAEEKIVVLADAVSLTSFENLDTTLALKQEKLKLAYVGSLFPGKGIETIVRLAAADKENQYDVYGERGPLEEWKTLAKEIGSRVNFMGQIENARVPETLTQYDVLLMPYSNKVEVYGEELTYWMSPLKMFEYMASGRVIISSNLPVIREILTDRRNAYLVEPDNVQAWLETVREVEADREKAKEIAKQALCDVKQYTWDERARRVSELL